MKKLVGGNPQDLISWVIPGAQFGKQLPLELSVENIYADGLLQATLDGKEFLAHLEFQSSYDGRIGERLLEYNVLASRQYNYLPVFSCVIYLKNHTSVPHSPFRKGLPNGEEVVRFHYRSIELGKLVAGELLQTGLVGLEQGLETQRQTLLDIVQERFPSIARMAKQQVDTIEDPEMLRRLIVKISIVKTSKEAEQYLLNPGSLENRH